MKLDYFINIYNSTFLNNYDVSQAILILYMNLFIFKSIYFIHDYLEGKLGLLGLNKISIHFVE